MAMQITRAAVSPLRPTASLPGLHVVAPPRRDEGVATAYALCHCGWRRTAIGRGDAQSVAVAYAEHHATCTTPKEGA